MGLFTLANWPLLFISVAMIVCAVVDAWKFKVPNVLTFPLILTGWALGVLHNLGLADGIQGGFGSSLVCTALGFVLLLPVYRIGGMGAGDVKMQMGFGAWAGAFFGMDEGVKTVLCAFAAAVIIGGILAVGLILIKRKTHFREILADLLRAPGLTAISDRAAQRKSRLILLPYGVPLCLGFVGYLFYCYG
jgi:prepilin peptidase CpaA